MTTGTVCNFAHTARPHRRNPEQNDTMYDQHVTNALFFYVPNISKPAFAIQSFYCLCPLRVSDELLYPILELTDFNKIGFQPWNFDSLFVFTRGANASH